MHVRYGNRSKQSLIMRSLYFRRECNTEHGTIECWKQTTDGFTYGLSTAMVDYCQMISQLQQLDENTWYNTSRDILKQQIQRYSIENGVRQLSKDDVEHVAMLILDKVN